MSGLLAGAEVNKLLNVSIRHPRKVGHHDKIWWKLRIWDTHHHLLTSYSRWVGPLYYCPSLLQHLWFWSWIPLHVPWASRHTECLPLSRLSGEESAKRYAGIHHWAISCNCPVTTVISQSKILSKRGFLMMQWWWCVYIHTFIRTWP